MIQASSELLEPRLRVFSSWSSYDAPLVLLLVKMTTIGAVTATKPPEILESIPPAYIDLTSE